MMSVRLQTHCLYRAGSLVGSHTVGRKWVKKVERGMRGLLWEKKKVDTVLVIGGNLEKENSRRNK